MMITIEIPTRFRGPPHSGNGGYVAGRCANLLATNMAAECAVEVTLRAPTPLDTALMTIREDEALRVRASDTLIAEAKWVPFALEPPRPVSWDEALAAQPHSYSLPWGHHPHFGEVRRGVHPLCFCCGAEPARDEGLHVYAAPLMERNQVAAAWRPAASWALPDGTLPPEIIWTALDCPGQMAWRRAGTQTGMLGRLTARIDRPVHAEEPCVVMGWTLGNEGKKYFAGTALFNERGELCAYAKAVWIGKIEPMTVLATPGGAPVVTI